MKLYKLFFTLFLSCFLSIAMLTESNAQVIIQNFDNAVGTFFPDPPTTNQDFFASDPGAVFDLSNYSADSYEGSGSMKIDYEVGYDTWGGWIVRTTYNVLSGNTSLPYIDLSSGKSLSLWYKVLVPAGLTVAGTVAFEFKLAEFNDAGDRELWQYFTTLNLTDNSGNWENVTIPLKQDADNTKGFVLQIGNIDGVLQLDKIKGFEIAISYLTTESPATTPIATGSLLLDKLQLFGSYNIYMVNAKTGNVERVTFIDDADEYNPSFSNNGKKVAHDVVGGSAPEGHSIYITDISSGVSSLLAGAEGGNDASWSPNGLYIAFDRGPVEDLNIYIVPANGGTRSLVRENGVDAEWSNNSKRLVFQDITDGSLRTVDLSGGTETIVAASGSNPSWSGNGKYIAYSDGNNIFKIAVNEAGEPQGSPVQLTNDGSAVFNQQPSWSNNSKKIVFHSNRESGDFDLWTISASGGTPSLLTGDPDNGDYDPCYSKNGKYVAYAGFTSADPSSPQGNGKTVSTNEISVPTLYALDQNFPNPFNPSTVINYQIPNAGYVTLQVYDMLGNEVATLVNENQIEGRYNVSFDASSLSSGVYIYQLRVNDFLTTKKMLLMK